VSVICEQKKKKFFVVLWKKNKIYNRSDQNVDSKPLAVKQLFLESESKFLVLSTEK